MTATTRSPDVPVRRAIRSRLLIILLLFVALLIVATIAASIGAAGIPINRLAAALQWVDGDAAFVARDRLVLWSIRLPRIALAVMVGALLAGAGTIMQGLFRNPLADPGLVGVSAGAGLAAATTIVIGDRLLAGSTTKLPFEVLPFAAFLGGLATTSMLYRIATRDGRTLIAVLILSGLAIGALAGA